MGLNSVISSVVSDCHASALLLSDATDQRATAAAYRHKIDATTLPPSELSGIECSGYVSPLPRVRRRRGSGGVERFYYVGKECFCTTCHRM